MTDITLSDVSMQEAHRRLYSGVASLEETLEWMKRHGSSVLLNWGEDNDAWECSWISGGARFTGCRRNPRMSVLESFEKCLAHLDVARRIGIEK